MKSIPRYLACASTILPVYPLPFAVSAKPDCGKLTSAVGFAVVKISHSDLVIDHQLALDFHVLIGNSSACSSIHMGSDMRLSGAS